MKISLHHRIFTEDPYVLFAQQHEVSPKIWYEMYNKRYMWYGYEVPILSEYFNLKTGKNLNERTIRRWIKRTGLYTRAQFARNKGAQEVSADFFDNIVTEQELVDMLK